EQREYVSWTPLADPFDSANMRRSAASRTNPANPAPRRSGDLGAMHAAYRSGHVFTGGLDIPVIDLRQYLEPELDMHHSRQSFSARARLQSHPEGRGDEDGRDDRGGNGDKQVIWF